MGINIVAVGKIKEDYMRAGIAEYVKRLGSFVPLSIVEVDEYRLKDKPSDKDILLGLEKEADGIMKAIKPQDYVVALAIEGKALGSEDVARNIEAIRATHGTLVFVIGSSYGLAETIKKRAQERWSLSNMTWPHQIVRFVWLEQLYRAFKIMNNEQYHK